MLVTGLVRRATGPVSRAAGRRRISGLEISTSVDDVSLIGTARRVQKECNRQSSRLRLVLGLATTGAGDDGRAHTQECWVLGQKAQSHSQEHGQQVQARVCTDGDSEKARKRGSLRQLQGNGRL